MLQNEVNQYTVETAFSNYLEKLDGVAQLEIAGFYQEDDGDNTIIHVGQSHLNFPEYVVKSCSIYSSFSIHRERRHV